MTEPTTNGHISGHVTFRRSDSIASLFGALAKAQGAMTGAKKDSANPFFKSKYADLQSVWEAIREPLAANGLAILQFPRANNEGVEVETVLGHESGEWVSEILSLPVGKYDPQGIGSAITYARRYLLQSIVGVAPEDDDGNAAARSAQLESNRPTAQQIANTPQVPKAPPIPYCTDGQKETIAELAKQTGIIGEQWTPILKHHNVKRINNLTMSQADDVILGLARRHVDKLLTELQVNLDDVRIEVPSVAADMPDELDMDQANNALAFLRAYKERNQ